MPEFVAAIIVDDYSVGDKFTIWPLHITLLPPFEASSIKEVTENLNEVVESTHTFSVHMGEYAKFGPKTIVQKIIPSPELSSLHLKMLDKAKDSKWKIPEKYTGIRYTPHITRKLERDYGQPTFFVSKVAIVQSIGLGSKEIVNELELADE